MAAGPRARLVALLGSESAREAAETFGGRVVAVGWATVELDRAVIELEAALGLPSGRFADAHPSPSLGARCLVAPDALAGGTSLVLLEPNTEGRLAATLARNDEGPAAVWVAVEAPPETDVPLRASGPNLSQAVAGPFGQERLILDGPIHGPHRLLIQRPGTIRS